MWPVSQHKLTGRLSNLKLFCCLHGFEVFTGGYHWQFEPLVGFGEWEISVMGSSDCFMVPDSYMCSGVEWNGDFGLTLGIQLVHIIAE